MDILARMYILMRPGASATQMNQASCIQLRFGHQIQKVLARI